jgi:hypothetical protein
MRCPSSPIRQQVGRCVNHQNEELPGRRKYMLEPSTRVEMTKGYRGIRGVIIEQTESPFEFYVLRLVNGIHLVAGPSAFRILQPEDGD